jgi:hypothetical protein
MQAEVHSPLKKLLFTAALTLLLPLFSAQSRAQGDPPVQAGRVSFASGTVSFQPAGLQDWGQAEVNEPYGPGDRIFTDSDGRAEIQIGRISVRVGPDSDVTLMTDAPNEITLGIGQGSVHIHALGLWPGQAFRMNTPSGTASIYSPADMRVDVLPDQDTTIFTDLYANSIVEGAGGFQQQLLQGQSLELAGSNPVVPQYLSPAAPDDLDIWSQQRDRQIAMAASWQYISPEIPGGEDLDANGSWMPGTPYGAVWFPNVAPGWAPYHYGRWINHAPWGPVWVEDEPWGYAPFHYGRWVVFQGRWGWVPGPRQAHPVWSPALVVFGGGVQVGGAAVSVWFPLGPGEPYRPWYPCSPRYIDQVNISNMAEGPRVHVLTTYAGFNFAGINFALRTVGVSAMRQDDFAAGRPVRQANVVVNVNVIQHVTIIERPVVQVNERVIINRPPARPVPVAAARPALINEKGMVVSAQPGFHPVAAPMKPAPPVRALPGRQAVAPPPGSHVPPANYAHPMPAAPQAPPNRNATQPPPREATTPLAPSRPVEPTTPAPPAHPAGNPAEYGAKPGGNPPAGEGAPRPQGHPQPQTPKPPAQNTVTPPEKTTPQPGPRPGETSGPKPGEKPGNGHNGKPEDKDKKEDHKGDKPENK